MKYKYLYFFIFLLSTCNIFSQQDQKAEDEYATYFTLPREAIHLHLNKTSYFSGEEIWFKGYTYDQKNQLTSKATTNINVGIYDAQGKQLKKALYKAENGTTRGNFLIDSTYTAGTYYIKAETNWMKNFKENNAFIQKIEIITEETTEKEATSKEKKYDFQFLPEGGHMVVNTKNNIGFKIIDENGQGVEVSGIVYDENKQEVTSFEGNALGLGKFLFQPKDNQKYTAEIKLITGEVIEQPMPKAKERGVSMILNNPFPDKVIINFSTNKETLEANSSKKYKILIHQTGNLKTINFSFDSGNEKIISVAKSELFKGINTITLFDEDENPILERLFFNDFFLKESSINVSEINKIEDSILFSISELKLQSNVNISISILPEATEAYAPNHNIISNFYLKPYIKGTVQNPQYYFSDMDRKKKYDLDILLLTQGWSRYNWKDVFSNKPKRINHFENGITITGKVNRPASGIDRLFLYATKNHSGQFIELDKNQKFTLTNFFLEEGEEIRFSYIKKKGAFGKPNMYLQYSITNKKDRISKAILNQKTIKNSNSTNFILPKNFLLENAESLGTVFLEGKKKEEERDPLLLNGTITKITLKEYERYINITDLIQDSGYKVTSVPGGLLIQSNKYPNHSPVIYYDGAQIQESSFFILAGLSTVAFEKVTIDRHAIAPVSGGGFGGIIRLYSRKTKLFKKSPKQLYSSSKAPYAFTPAKEYYMPKYNSYLNNTFEKYGAISWIPELKLSKSQAVNFKVFDTKTKNITLFIEGISENGDLISEQKTIQVR